MDPRTMPPLEPGMGRFPTRQKKVTLGAPGPATPAGAAVVGAAPSPLDKARSDAYAALLQQAAVRGDQGASSDMMRGNLWGVDIGRPGRLGSMWDARNQQYADAGAKELAAVSAAYAAQRAKRGAGARSGLRPKQRTVAPPKPQTDADLMEYLILQHGDPQGNIRRF